MTFLLDRKEGPQEVALSRHAIGSNEFLAALPEADRSELSSRLRTVDLARRAVLHNVGENFRGAYFPHDGIVSLVVDLSTGEMIEAGTVGRDGVVGGAAGTPGAIALNRAVVQVEGRASLIGAEDLRAVADRSPSLRNKLLLHQHFLLGQAQQCAACNASHPIERRLARWLLRCRDLTRRDELPLTQEFVAEMLGVRRSSVSIVANILQRAGLIEYRRGHLRMLDVDGLRRSACECYDAINSLAGRLLGGSPPSAAPAGGNGSARMR